MKAISLQGDALSPDAVDEIVQALRDGALVGLPTPSGYKIAADFADPKAVLSLIQAKRRVQNAPALVLVPDKSWAENIADELSPAAHALMAQFWPGPLTLLCAPSPNLDAALRKSLTRAKGWLGLRMPSDAVSKAIVTAMKGPIVVSSANLSRKVGDISLAQVKKNFGRHLHLIVERGDIVDVQSSTLVDVSAKEVRIVREGAVPADHIAGVLAQQA